MNTNLFGAINVTCALLPHFRVKQSGVIVYTGSLGGIAGEVGGSAYCASKFALEGRNDHGLFPSFCFTHVSG